MYRSFFVVVDGPADLCCRYDYFDFHRAFQIYRSCGPARVARLYGVDQLDCSVLLGEHCGL